MYKLEFSNVSLSYAEVQGGTGLSALEGLSLAVHAGESVALIGPSGCGKSSALRLAAGLLHPTSGEVTIDGSHVEGPRTRTALILQDFGLLPWKSALANVELGLRIRGVQREQRRQKALQALRLVGLEQFADAYPSSLSGGMQQRLALARSIALDVDLLLMDEPLSALDALLREQLQDSLLELWQHEGYAQVLVTHSIEEAAYLGQRVIVLSGRPGHVVGVMDNPGMGSCSYRDTPEFFELCNALRAMLHAGSADAYGREGCDA